jgi:hypothetical protein
MAIILIRFDGGNVPITTGAIPPNDDTPISNPTRTGFETNEAFRVDQGEYCFGLDTSVPYAPQWLLVQAVDGVPTNIRFRRTKRSRRPRPACSRRWCC